MAEPAKKRATYADLEAVPPHLVAEIIDGELFTHLWIIDPRQQLLEAFALRDGEWLIDGARTSDDLVSAPPFHAISISLADLWPLDRPLSFNEDPMPLYAGDR